MKNRSWLIFVVFSLFFFISCGGDENESAGDEENEDVAVSIRAVNDAGCTGMQIDCLSDQLAAVSFQIRNGQGETVFQKSVDRKELRSKRLTFKGIKNAENATLTVAAFGTNSEGVADLNTPKWEGRVSGLKFEKGLNVSVTVLLYPKAVQSKEISMPEELSTPRFGSTATVLADGRVLVAGGFTKCSALSKCPASKKVEIIDLESGRIEALADMVEERAMHTAVALNDGSVLFIGGVHTLDANWQESAFEGFPLMRYVMSTATVKIEKYMPSYPKYNMKANGFGSPVANISETVPSASDIPFTTFQSVLAERISDTEIAVFLVGGLDENGAPSKQSYKFVVTETEDGNVSVGELTTLAETSEPMLLPSLAYIDGSLIAVGGRPSDSEVAASVISKDESTDFGSASDNMFFAKGLVANGKLYTFGGYGVKDGSLDESAGNKVKKWDASEKITEKTLRSNGMNVVFPEVVYDKKNNKLIMIGGTNVSNLYQVIDAENLSSYDKPYSHYMTDSRLMSSAAIVPSGVISDSPLILIIGGVSAFDDSGSVAASIKINNLRSDF